MAAVETETGKLLLLIRDFESNSVEFFTTKDLIKSSFVSDVLLQVLKSETVVESWKLKCLVLLQDYSLVSNAIETKCVVEKLKSIYKGAHSVPKSNDFLKSQILITMTTLCLETLGEVIDEDTEKLLYFIDLFDELVQLIMMVNNAKNCLLRGAACECLLEIEITYPGLFIRMLDTLRDLCNSEKSFIYEKYALLFCTVLSNHCTQENNPFSMSQKLVAHIINHQHDFQSILTSPLLTTVEVKQGIFQLLENLSSVSNSAAVAIARKSLIIVQSSKSIPKSIFKTLLLAYKDTYDVQLLHLFMDLLAMLKEENEEMEENEAQLLSHLIYLSNMPALSTCERLLFLDWLEYLFPNNAIHLNQPLCLKLCPNSTDTWQIIIKKMNLFPHVIRHSKFAENKQSAIFWRCLLSVYHSAEIQMTRGAVGAIFKGLLIYLKNYNESTVEINVQSIIFSLAKHYPAYILHIHDFLKCIKKEFPDSLFPLDLQKDLVSTITDFTISSSDLLSYYLTFLNEILLEPVNICQPQEISKYLLLLLQSSTICMNGDWLLGNQILNLCKSLLYYHDSRYFFSDLGEVLHVIMRTHQDLEVREESRFLYMLLMNLSSEKISDIFKSDNVEKRQIDSYSNFETESENYTKIYHLDKPLLQMVKTVFDNTRSEAGTPSDDIIPKNTLKPYRTYIGNGNFKSCVQIQYKLSFVSEAPENFNDIYCVHIEFQGPPSYGLIDDVLVPHLSRNECHVVVLNFFPTIYEPNILLGRVQFNNDNGLVYEFEIDEIQIDFEDHFLSLPVPETFASVSQHWREMLFDDLWMSFVKNSKLGAHLSHCQQSIVWISKTGIDLKNILHGIYHRFLIASDEVEDKIIYKLGIFLPSTTHVLLQCASDEDGCVVTLVVDNWQVLDLVNDFILSLERK